MEHHDRVVKEMIDVVEEMVDTKTVEMAAEIDSVEAITVVAVMKTAWMEIGNVQNVTITTSQEETSVTDAVYLVPEAAAVDTEAVVMAEEILDEAVAEVTVAVTELCTKVAIVAETQVVAAIEVDTVVETMVVETQVVETIEADTVVETMVVETQVVVAIEHLSKITIHIHQLRKNH